VLAIVIVPALLLVAGLALATRWGGDSLPEPDPPVGTAVLPDLMPKPQLNVTTGQVDGRWHIFFSTIIVNVGKSDFLLRAVREGRGWRVEQGVPYSVSGARIVPTKAVLAWGGDGHDHWHVARVATVRLVPLDASGRPKRVSGRTDTKVGFCFYDHTHELERGPEKAVFSAHSCGTEGDTLIGVGLSPGWNDTYRQSLPGQSIDVSGLPDGRYRLWTDIDEQGWFREASRANNRTWIDLDLRATPEGLSASTLAWGPSPSPVFPRS
jgi:hypothetical protein